MEITMIVGRSRPPRTLTYILRLWETRSLPPDPGVTWRLSLENTETGERIGFSSLSDLLGFLSDELRSEPCQEEGKERD
jgi:hypothetical protein